MVFSSSVTSKESMEKEVSFLGIFSKMIGLLSKSLEAEELLFCANVCIVIGFKWPSATAIAINGENSLV